MNMNLDLRAYTDRLRQIPLKVVAGAAGVFATLFVARKVHGKLSSSGEITLETVTKFIKSDKSSSDTLIIDLRQPDEYRLNHVESAFNLDYSSPLFSDLASKLDTDKRYLIYSNDPKTNAKAAKTMQKLGFKKIYYPPLPYIDWMS